MTEWESFVNTWQREFQTTIKVLRNFPAGLMDFKPHEKSRTAAHLAEGFIVEEDFLLEILKGQLDFSKLQYTSPATWDAILKKYEERHAQVVEEAKALGESEFNKSMLFPTASGKMEERRRGDLGWLMLYDFIHHRGQFSVYLRMVGAKVPSIYGPSLDEPWPVPK